MVKYSFQKAKKQKVIPKRHMHLRIGCLVLMINSFSNASGQNGRDYVAISENNKKNSFIIAIPLKLVNVKVAINIFLQGKSCRLRLVWTLNYISSFHIQLLVIMQEMYKMVAHFIGISGRICCIYVKPRVTKQNNCDSEWCWTTFWRPVVTEQGCYTFL